ncbi:MAG: leucine-rich repeat domain-containing protein [Clostridia bacterium]|nr:leucine-rich repeat domain-containing protein [Clostridia bacterium]
MKKFLTLMLAVVLATALALPAFAAKPDTRAAVPEGYNEHDYNKLVAFLEQTDDADVKNGEKLSENYDPADPKTWGEGCFEWIDVDGKLSVEMIEIGEHGLSGKLDVSGCTALERLDCYENRLTELNVSGCTALEFLDCYENRLTELNVSGCTALEFLDCAYNSLTELDVSGFTALEFLDCAYNSLNELDVSGFTALEFLDCAYNSLNELDVSGFTALETLFCSNNSLTELDVSGFTALRTLSCHDNSLTELDASGCTALIFLYCYSNSLTELDVSGCTALEALECDFNSLTDLDVSNNTALEYLSCMNNCLKELDLSNNPRLPGESIKAEGSGYIGCGYWDLDGMFIATANAAEGATFLGWYNEAGEELSTETEFPFTDDGEKKVIAKFSESAVEPDPTEAPVEPTEVPVEPTEAPVEPQPTGNPGEPTPVPPTGAISVIGIGVAALIAGAGVFAARKKND